VRRRLGRLTVGAYGSRGAIPRPRLSFLFEETDVLLSLSVGPVWSDPLFTAEIAVTLPARVADALDVALPDRDSGKPAFTRRLRC